MEEWVLVGESGSDAESVQLVDCSVSDNDKGSDMSFTTVQIGGNHRASADALDSSVDDLIAGGENEEEGESNGEYGYFDLDLPALAGSKAVFGASDDCFDLNLAASILSMGSAGCDDTAGTQGGRHLDDIDRDSICAEDSESSGIAAAAVKEQPASCSRGRLLDDIDMENAVHELIYGNETMIRMQYLARARKDAAQAVSYNDIDTDSSDAEESDYSDDGTESTDAEEESDDCTESSDEEESDDDDTESSDEEESDCSDDSTECADASGTTGGGNDARNSHIAAALQRLAAAREASSLPPTSSSPMRPSSSPDELGPPRPRQRRRPPVRPTSTSATESTN